MTTQDYKKIGTLHSIFIETFSIPKEVRTLFMQKLNLRISYKITDYILSYCLIKYTFAPF
jgi:hypothetical protein